MKKETWLDKYDYILETSSDALITARHAQLVIGELSKEINNLHKGIDTWKEKNDQNFELFRQQCKTTEHWIKRYQVIENMGFLKRLHFLLTNDLSILDRR